MLQASRLVKKANQSITPTNTPAITNIRANPSVDVPRRPTALRQIYLKHELAGKANIYRAKNT